jgi:two-component system, NarL family, response regulator DevR
MTQDKNGNDSTKVKVFLLAENRLLRETLVRLLEKKGGVLIAGVSRYTDSTIEEIMASGCSIVLMDSLATTRGTTLICDLREMAPQLGVILFGMDEDPDAFLRSAYLGVSGYVLKEASASEIVAAVLGVAREEAMWPPRLCMTLLRHLSQEYRTRSRISFLPGGSKYCLTHRQLELMRLVEKGLTNKEIAVNLNLSEFTVKNHLSRIMKELDAEDRHEAVEAIRASGLFPTA